MSEWAPKQSSAVDWSELRNGWWNEFANGINNAAMNAAPINKRCPKLLRSAASPFSCSSFCRPAQAPSKKKNCWNGRALFPSCSIKFDWFIDCGPSGWAGQQSIWIQSTFLSFLFSGLWAGRPSAAHQLIPQFHSFNCSTCVACLIAVVEEKRASGINQRQINNE